jgi:hypothetical protein
MLCLVPDHFGRSDPQPGTCLSAERVAYGNVWANRRGTHLSLHRVDEPRPKVSRLHVDAVPLLASIENASVARKTGRAPMMRVSSNRPLRRVAAASMAAAAALFLAAAPTVSAFEVNITDSDQLRQTCSGMWAGKDTQITCACHMSVLGAAAKPLSSAAGSGSHADSQACFESSADAF